MIDNVNQIKEIATDIRDTTSTNDGRHKQSEDIMRLCDGLILHFVDDGR